MYCVVYEFKIKSGQNDIFEKAWADFTEAIHTVCGSLGSRLHRTGDTQIYVAYAQWPSKNLFEADVSLDSYSLTDLEARTAMKNAVESTKKVYLLEVVDDRLRAGQ